MIPVSIRRKADLASPIAHSIAGLGIYWIARRNRSLHRPILHDREFLTGCGLAVLAANLPDLDLVAGLIGGRYFHHQITHTFLFALALGFLVRVSARVFRYPASRSLMIQTIVLISSHVIIDYFTRDTSVPKGCMLFWPLSDRYFMFPKPLFIDIWRMTPRLMFGFNNLNAALREMAFGSAFLAMAVSVNRFPIRVRPFLFTSFVLFSALSFFAHQPLTARAEQQLLRYLGQYPATQTDPSVTPRNAGIVFSSKRTGNSDIFVIQPDGSDLKQLTGNPADDSWPSWSPDGAWIAYQSDRSGNMDIWLMGPDGMNARNLTERSAAIDETPAWTAGGNQIVFCSHRSGEPELYVMNLDGTGVKSVTAGIPGRELMPDVSPVEDSVAYTGENPPFPGWSIFSVSLNGSAPQKISPAAGCRGKWSPDGRILAYISAGSEPTSDLYLFSVSGGPHRRVTASVDHDYDPCFSPSGDKLCFCRGQGGEKAGWDLWIVDLRSGSESRLTYDGNDNRTPSWR